MNTKLAYTIPGFCDASSLGRSKVYEEIAAGKLRAVKSGARTLITAEDGRAYIKSLPAVEPKDEDAAEKAAEKYEQRVVERDAERDPKSGEDESEPEAAK